MSDHHAPTSTAPAGHAAHDGHDSHASVSKYWFVFGVLMVGTILTVGMYFVHFDSVPLTILIALTIASIKAFFVAGYFMHLISEKKMIYGILASTAFFFVGLMGLTVWAMQDYPTFTSFTSH